MVEVEVCTSYNAIGIEESIKEYIKIGYKLQGYSSFYNPHTCQGEYSVVMVKE